MIFNSGCVTCQLQYFLVSDGEAFPVLAFYRDIARGYPGHGIGGVDQFTFFAAQLALEDGAAALSEGGLEHVKLIRVDRALHHIFP